MRSRKSEASRWCAACTSASRVSRAGSPLCRQAKAAPMIKTLAVKRERLAPLTDFTPTFSRLCNRRERIRVMTRKRAAAVLIVALFLCTCDLFAADKPSLIVVISVDQMRADYLDRFRPYFGKDGFNRFLEYGAVYPEARYRHAITYTG